MKKAAIGLVGVSIVLLLLALGLLNVSGVQDALLAQGAKAQMSQTPRDSRDILRVFVCGSSSPIPAPGRAQACIAIVTPQHFYLIDSGAGSTTNLMSSKLPLERLDGILITHFHSDHIAELYEVNLNSWVQGRPKPLLVMGPTGIVDVIDGINTTYSRDVGYRVAHHSPELLPPELGILHAKVISPGVVIDQGGLRIQAIAVNHAPIDPALGFRIDYKDRSVLVTGDSVITDSIRQASQDLDLLLTDALSLPIILTLAETAEGVGRTRNARILTDVTDYHASTDSIVSLIDQADIQLTAYYHMVPSPSNIIMQKIYERDLPDNAVLTEDRMWFELEVGGDKVNVVTP
jgi:ribonuclease Z